MQDFNESTSLALSAYSHFIIATIRVAGVVVASTTVQPPDRIIVANSFLFSADVLLSLGLYFGPKFWNAYHRKEKDKAKRETDSSRMATAKQENRVRELEDVNKLLRRRLQEMDEESSTTRALTSQQSDLHSA